MTYVSPPLFSVVVCFRNAKKTLRKAIESVRAQTVPDWEIVLVDDASTDGSSSVYASYAKDPRVRAHRNSRREGIGANKALACRIARGEYLAILDGDDSLEPHALSTVLGAYRADLRRAMVYSTHWRVDEGRRTRADWVKPYPVQGTAGAGTDVVSHFLTFRRREYQLCGGYDEGRMYATDKQIVAAMETMTYPHLVEELLYHYTVPRAKAAESLESHRQTIAKASFEESGLSIVIPYHKRASHLRRCLDAIGAARPKVPFEVILVCWADDFDASAYTFVRKVESFDGHEFNLGRLRNVGARKARFRKLFFMDCDIVPPRSFIDLAFERVAYKTTWFPICLDEGARPGMEDGWRVHGYGLCGVTKRDLFWSGGWPEFDEWGCEDTLQHFKLRHDGCTVRREKIPGLVHLRHPYFGYRSEAHADARRAELRRLAREYEAACRGFMNPEA